MIFTCLLFSYSCSNNKILIFCLTASLPSSFTEDSYEMGSTGKKRKGKKKKKRSTACYLLSTCCHTPWCPSTTPSLLLQADPTRCPSHQTCVTTKSHFPLLGSSCTHLCLVLPSRPPLAVVCHENLPMSGRSFSKGSDPCDTNETNETKLMKALVKHRNKNSQNCVLD